MSQKFLKYNNIVFDDGFNHNMFNKNKEECINECLSDKNCLGLNIYDPECNKNLYSWDECLNKFTKIGINKNIDNIKKYKCKIINNIDNSNKIYNSENNVSVVKNKYVNFYNKDILDKYYYLKIENKYLGINYEFDNLFLVSIDNIDLASLFKFNSSGNIIEKNTNKCLTVNGKYIILNDCDDYDENQNFIYENKFNTITHQKEITNKQYCLTLTDHKNKRIFLEECSYGNNNNHHINFNQKITNEMIDIEKEQEQEQEQEKQNDVTENNTDSNIDNFNLLDDNFNLVKKEVNSIDFCENNTYKIIVTLILIIIVLYFIWYIYTNNNLYNN